MKQNRELVPNPYVMTPVSLGAASVLAAGVVGYYHAQGIDLPDYAVYGALGAPAAVHGLLYLGFGAVLGTLVGGVGYAVADFIHGDFYIEDISPIDNGALVGAGLGAGAGLVSGAAVGGLEATIGYGFGYALGKLM